MNEHHDELTNEEITAFFNEEQGRRQLEQLGQLRQNARIVARNLFLLTDTPSDFVRRFINAFDQLESGGVHDKPDATPEGIAANIVNIFMGILHDNRLTIYADIIFAGYQPVFNESFDQLSPPSSSFVSNANLRMFARRGERVLLAIPAIRSASSVMPPDYDSLQTAAVTVGARFL